MVAAVAKLDKAATASDDSERAKKVFQSKADEDEKRITALEKELKEAREKAEAADATYDDVAKKLATCEGDLEKAEERADVGEDKIIELEEELRLWPTTSSPLRWLRRRPTRGRRPTRNRSRPSARSCRRRWTGWRMSWSLSRRSTRPSLRSWSRPLLKCPDTNFLIFYHPHCNLACFCPYPPHTVNVIF